MGARNKANIVIDIKQPCSNMESYRHPVLHTFHEQRFNILFPMLVGVAVVKKGIEEVCEVIKRTLTALQCASTEGIIQRHSVHREQVLGQVFCEERSALDHCPFIIQTPRLCIHRYVLIKEQKVAPNKRVVSHESPVGGVGVFFEHPVDFIDDHKVHVSHVAKRHCWERNLCQLNLKQ